MKKRLTAMLMVVALLVSLLSTGAMAVEGPGDVGGDESVTKVSTSSNGITINKEVTEESDGNYTLTLEAYAENSISEVTQPLDIVLVLDTSGSMNNEISGEAGYVSTGEQNFTYGQLSSWYTTYYFFDGAEYYEVKTRNDGGQGWFEDPEYYAYYEDYQGHTHDLNDRPTDRQNETIYTGVLYTYSDGSMTKLAAMQDAVEQFISSVADNAKENSVNHRIGIVEFAGDAYDVARLQNAADNEQILINAVNALNATGATYAEEGLSHAAAMLRDSSNRKVVVFFTDGAPNHHSGFDGDVAAEAVNNAYSMKQDETLIYAIGMMDGANPSDIFNDFNKYMNGVSSNYPSAYAQYDSWSNMRLGTRVDASSQYYFAASSASELSGVFANISDSINSLTANPDEYAVLSDNLTEYFTFGETVTSTGGGVTAQYVPVTGKTNGEYTWGTPVDVTVNVSVEGDRIEVTGFDYKEKAVTEDNGIYSGGKLVISFPIKVSDVEITEAGYYDTNEIAQGFRAGLVYKASDASYTNNANTLLKQSPSVYLKPSVHEGAPITVEVYVDGAKKNASEYISIDGLEGTTDFGTTIEGDNIKITFTYDKYNAADFQITNKRSDLILQAISADLIGGTSGSGGIKAGENNTYTLDNVDGGSIVTVYLYTPYTVEYYVDSQLSTIYTDSNTYIVDSKTASGTAPDASGDVKTPVTATFADNASDIELQPLPTETGKTYSGWFLGSNDGEKQESPVDVKAAYTSATAEDVIEFYATSTDNDYTVSYNLNLPGGATGIVTPNTTTHNYNDPVTLDETITSSTTVKVGHDTYTFSGWTTAETESGTSVSISNNTITMPAENVIVSGTWTITSSDPTFDVTYKWENNEAPSDVSLPKGETGKYEGDEITVADGYEPVIGTNSDGVPGTWTFSGWTTDDVEVSDGSFTMPASNVEFTGSWTFTPNSYTITVEVVNGTAEPAGPTISVQHGDDQTITFTANEGYALESVTVDGDTAVFNGGVGTSYDFTNVTDNHTIKVVYAEDSNKDGTPDSHQATIKYNVVNGTWEDETDTPITYIVDTETYNETTGEWNPTGATLEADGRPIPTDMKPDANYIAPGTWDKTPDGEFVLVGEQTYEYTHTFSTLVDDSYSVTKTAKVGDTVLSGDSYVQVGDTITYTITVENTGNVALSNITLTDTFTGGNGTLSFGSLPDGVTVNDDEITITSIAVGSKVEITATYKVVDGDKTLTNTVTDGKGKKTTVTTDVADLDVTKTVSDESVNVGDTINYTITVKNTGNVELTDVVVSDEMLPATGVTVTGIDSNNYTVEKGEVTITTLPVGSTVTITYSYTTTEADATNGVTNSVTVKAGDDGPEGNDETETTVTDYTVTIAPADIVIYTGGDGYGGVIDDNGNLIEASESSGLPEPGYHLDLSEDLVQWLTDNGVTPAEHLENIIHFEYWEDVNGVSTMTRRWNLEYMGIYETDEDIGEPTRYVYRLVSVNDNQLPVRLAYGDGELITDDIVMSENSVSETHDITIYAGGIEQGNVIAVAKIPQTDGSEAKVKVNCSTEVGTGKLTIRSTVDDGNSNTAINATPSTDAVTAHTNGEVTFYVNDTEVIVDKNRVQLLLDQVSNNADFNAAMGEDAIATVLENNNLSDASYQLVYMDLVDTQNGNAVVTMGVGDSLKIYWPVPDDAASGSDFYIVHYYEMNREGTIDDIGNAATHQERATVEVVDGQRYVTFDVESFSPFVLVYETDDGYDPIIPTPDDDTEYVPKWLNTEDHFAYIVGYEDGEVKPNNNITRAEVATIFFRLLTDDARARYWSQTNDYTDVAADSWYNNAISTLSNMGIINGYEDGTFQPNASITRAEFTAIATRFFDYTAEYDGAFNDVSRSAWYADCVQAAVDMGLVDGYPDGGFHPNSNITRAEAVTIVNRVLNRAPHEDHLLDEDEMNVWPDNVYGAWYYADMQEATNSHDYDWIRVSGERVEEWTEKLPERDWAALEQEWSSAYSG